MSRTCFLFLEGQSSTTANDLICVVRQLRRSLLVISVALWSHTQLLCSRRFRHFFPSTCPRFSFCKFFFFVNFVSSIQNTTRVFKCTCQTRFTLELRCNWVADDLSRSFRKLNCHTTRKHESK